MIKHTTEERVTFITNRITEHERHAADFRARALGASVTDAAVSLRHAELSEAAASAMRLTLEILFP